MVELNVSIGQQLKNVTCCGVYPHVMRYHEDLHSFSIVHTCPKCGLVGNFGLIIPKEVRDKQLKIIRKTDENPKS